MYSNDEQLKLLPRVAAVYQLLGNIMVLKLKIDACHTMCICLSTVLEEKSGWKMSSACTHILSSNVCQTCQLVSHICMKQRECVR